MIDNWNAIDRMEHAERETPFCACGEPMIAVARAEGIWLECASLESPDGSRFSRLLAALTASSHGRRLIVDQIPDAA
jgi:hypothetical protein